MQKAVNFNVTIVSVKGNDYRIYFWYMNKDEVLNLLIKADLTEKVKYHKVKNFLNMYKNG